ncbi:phospholipase C [Algoriphagus chordae]|uniref:Phospholipase C n=1 Tax=Algoriphagus chordae TaxID=237019 RepID=A0A2W7QKE9_9BACT|nr:alkaline phosphatase family protein [Algoriphagus chordae]PZX47776.1 phospholipase C [Algoriphagus chordae]
MADVLTRVKVKELRNIPIGFGKAIEYNFTTKFNPSSEIVGGSKQIVVYVRQKGPEPLLIAPVEIQLINPNKLIVSEELTPFLSAKFSTKTALGNIKFPGKTAISVLDDLVDVGSPFDPTLPPPGPPAHLTQFKYTIKDNDPNGAWTIQIKNKGVQSENFEIDISHPDLQLKLEESAVPFSLLNRLLKKVNRLFAVSLKIDKNLTLDFSSKAKKMLGIDKIEIPIGELSTSIDPIKDPLTGLSVGSISVNFSLNNINLESLDLSVIPSDGDAIALAAEVVFETSGNEVNVVGPNVNITKLAVKSELAFKAPFNQSYYEERNLAGKLIASHSPISAAEPTILPTIHAEKFIVFKTQSGINAGAKSAIEKILKANSTKKILKTVAEHFTDMLLFLASGRNNQVFFDLQTTSKDFTVRHYSRPSAKIRLKDSLITTRPTMKVTKIINQSAPSKPSPIPTTSQKTRLHKSIFSSFKFGRFFQKDKASISIKPPTHNAPVKPDSKQIEHIVVLTLENRSFDHMLGYLTQKKNRTDVDGLGAAPNHTNPIPGTNFSHSVFKLTDGAKISVDPGHGVKQVKEQIANGEMSGFVSNYMSKTDIKNDPGSEKLVMGFYDDDTLGMFDFLAENYMICDRWFSSHPGATYPNRFISVMGSAPSINNFEIGGNEAGAVKGDTIFDILTQKNISWNYVESNIAFLRMFDKYRVDEKNIIQRDEWLSKARNGQLPAVSWIDPHIIDLEIEGEADDDHPPANVGKGQLGVKEIYDALKSNDLHWQKTLFIITYDEHGGFYDHVPPHGINGEGNPVVHKIHKDGASHYGLRVPAFIISPWVKPKSVSKTVFDHTSILKTILSNFIGPEGTNKELLGKRTDAANSILSVLDRRPRAVTPSTVANHQFFIAANAPGEINDREVSADSFHDNMLLFGFGSKFRKIVADQIKKKE